MIVKLLFDIESTQKVLLISSLGATVKKQQLLNKRDIEKSDFSVGIMYLSKRLNYSQRAINRFLFFNKAKKNSYIWLKEKEYVRFYAKFFSVITQMKDNSIRSIASRIILNCILITVIPSEYNSISAELALLNNRMKANADLNKNRLYFLHNINNRLISLDSRLRRITK